MAVIITENFQSQVIEAMKKWSVTSRADNVMGVDGKPLNNRELAILQFLKEIYPSLSSAHAILSMAFDYQVTLHEVRGMLTALRKRGYVTNGPPSGSWASWTLGPCADSLEERGVL